MEYRTKAVGAAALSLATLALTSFAWAADVAPMPAKAKPIIDVPFFRVNDNRLTYAYQFTGTSPGKPGETAKQVVAFTHFDVWAYGTNFFSVSLMKSDGADYAVPCRSPGQGCAGATEIYGLFRSTLGFNEVFNTKAFSAGPLRNVSFVFGADANTKNDFLAPAKRAVVAGLQFGFDLPYKGFFNVAPMYYQEWNHNSFLQTGTIVGPYPGIPDGVTRFNPTWAVEMNYYMDLGFLPESINYFSVSGRAGFYGPKGTGAAPGLVSPASDTKTEINSEPIRLTFDASKALWGPKYSHFVDVWVAYRYWKNKFGQDDSNVANRVCFTAAGVNNGSCTEKSLYAGVSVKF